MLFSGSDRSHQAFSSVHTLSKVLGIEQLVWRGEYSDHSGFHRQDLLSERMRRPLPRLFTSQNQWADSGLFASSAYHPLQNVMNVSDRHSELWTAGHAHVSGNSLL